MSKALDGGRLQLWGLRTLRCKGLLREQLYSTVSDIFGPCCKAQFGLSQMFFPWLPPFSVDLDRSFEMPVSVKHLPIECLTLTCP